MHLILIDQLWMQSITNVGEQEKGCFLLCTIEIDLIQDYFQVVCIRAFLNFAIIIRINPFHLLKYNLWKHINLIPWHTESWQPRGHAIFIRASFPYDIGYIQECGLYI